MELVTLIEKGGSLALLAVLGFLLWNERAERIDCQKRIDGMQRELLERTINALNTASQAIRELITSVQALTSTIQTTQNTIYQSRRDEGGGR